MWGLGSTASPRYGSPGASLFEKALSWRVGCPSFVGNRLLLPLMQRTAQLPFGASGAPWPMKEIDLAEIAQVEFNFKENRYVAST